MKKLCNLIVFTLLFTTVFAQSNVTLMDLSVSPYYPDSVNTTYPNQEMGIVFKMNQSPLAQQVHVLIGTAANQSNLDLFTANVIENNGLYYISYNGVEESIENYACKIDIALSQAHYADFTHITVFVTDINGNESNRLVFEK